MVEYSAKPIPFSFFVSLLREIAAIPARKPGHPIAQSTPANIFFRWVSQLLRQFSNLPPGTTAIVFGLLFPEDDVQRKFELQETRLARHLANIYRVSTHPDGRGAKLREWNTSDTCGCLGSEVHALLDASSEDIDGRIGALTIHQVDALLTELAATSTFSAPSIRGLRPGRARSREKILADLFLQLPAIDAAFLTQIILKDLRPLLYPLSPDAAHTTNALLQWKSNAAPVLTRAEAMCVWDPSGRLGRAYRARTEFEQAARVFEEGWELGPENGVPIEIPKSVKGQGSGHALRQFRSCGAIRVWAETKYDGERAQIHVRRDSDTRYGWRITIFSKSKRDSTMDRAALHPVIIKALNPDKDPGKCTTIEDVILDAEMVAFSDELNDIDEFWRIRSLVTSTALGVRRTRDFSSKGRVDVDPEIETQSSMISNASDGGTRRLALVFFDILMFNGRSLLSAPYEARRALLESVITPTRGYAMLAERSLIDLAGGMTEAAAELDVVWARAIAAREEGLVLKAEGGAYGDWRSPWVKVKRDYIKGYGDCVDLVVVGAGWERGRARELRVTPATYTTFYVGVLTNAKERKQDPNVRPHFEIYFSTSYGLDRAQLEELNFLIKTSNPISYKPSLASASHTALPYTFTLLSSIPAGPPRVLLHPPLLAELFGAGFTKPPGGRFYELRFPRLTKVHRRSERTWEDGVEMEELMRIARASVGRDRAGKEAEEWSRAVWGKSPGSPGVRCEKRRREEEGVWEGKLARAEGREKKRRAKERERQEKRARARFQEDEENEGEGETTAKSLRGLTSKALGSMTNIAASLDFGHAADALTTPKDGPTIQRNDPDFVKPDQNMTIAPRLLPPVALYPAPPVSGSKKRAAKRPPSPTAKNPSQGAALMALLDESKSLVWFLRPTGTPRPTWCPPSNSFVPHGHRIHGLDAFLGGCAWARQGVVLVDGAEDVEEARRLLVGDAMSKRQIPVIVVNLREALECLANVEMVELGRLAAYRFD